MTQNRTQTFAAGAAHRPDPAGRTATNTRFVINLCTLQAPITVPQPRDSRLTRYSFFLSRAWVDGQRQYRLLMGYFSATAEADRWLATLKRVYPGAYISEAPEVQPDLMSDTQQLRVLNIGQIGVGGTGPSATVLNKAGKTEPVAPRLPPTRELFVRDADTTGSRRAAPSLEDTLDELRTSEFDMGSDDDLNSTGVRHLRIEVQPKTAGGRSLPRPGSRVRR